MDYLAENEKQVEFDSVDRLVETMGQTPIARKRQNTNKRPGESMYVNLNK